MRIYNIFKKKISETFAFGYMQKVKGAFVARADINRSLVVWDLCSTNNPDKRYSTMFSLIYYLSSPGRNIFGRKLQERKLLPSKVSDRNSRRENRERFYGENSGSLIEKKREPLHDFATGSLMCFILLRNIGLDVNIARDRVKNRM